MGESMRHAQPPPAEDRILQRSSRFDVAGFARRLGEPMAAPRAAAEQAREERRAAHDAQRGALLRTREVRTGFDAMRSAQVPEQAAARMGRSGPAPGGAHDDFEPRGTRRVTADGGDMREVEVAVRMREPNFRFYRIENPEEPRLQHRTKVLLDAGMRDGQQNRKSSLLGFGRKDLKSFGAADAFAAADYGGTAWVHELEQKGAELLAASAGAGAGASSSSAAASAASDADGGADVDVPFFMKTGPRDVWDVGRVDPDAVRRRALATQRAPNRIFDTTSAPVVLHAMPDPVQRAMRETNDILRSRPPRPIDRPASFTAHANHLSAQRERRAQQAEVDLVRGLAAVDER
jgi:hypothetical protein